MCHFDTLDQYRVVSIPASGSDRVTICSPTRPQWFNTQSITWFHGILSFWKMLGFFNCDNISSWFHLIPGRCDYNLKFVTFKLISMINILNISCESAIRWMSQNAYDGVSRMVQVMACCHQAASHCLSQCWPRSVSIYGISRPNYVNSFIINTVPALD